MVSDDQARALFAQAPEGPPLRMNAADLIGRGTAVRRRRKKWAVAGSSAATVAVLVAAGLAAGSRGTGPAPVMPAGPGLATVSPAPDTPAPKLPSGPAQSSDAPPGSRVTGPGSRVAPTGQPGDPRPGATRGSPASPPRAHPTTADSAPQSPGLMPGSTALPSQTSR